MRQSELDSYFKQIAVVQAGAKKGKNGRVLVIGGSRLFHAASFWSAAMAAYLVDMVHFSSPTQENNELMRVRAKEKFWEGIVMPWEEVEHYVEEDEAILIGPGMERGEMTKRIVNSLLERYPAKKWVVDGGALQMVTPELLTPSMVVTPNAREREILAGRVPGGVTALFKGTVDVVSNGQERVEIRGGSGGMAKGGTGDVLSGLVAGLYAKSPAFPSCVVASYVNKRAGEKLFGRVGPYFSPLELLKEVPGVLWQGVKGCGRVEV